MVSIYRELDNRLICNYLLRLVGKIYKILPLKEAQSETVSIYIYDLNHELLGFTKLLEDSGFNSKILDIVSTLEQVRTCEMLHAEYRRNIFKCMTLARQLCDIVSDEVEHHEG